MSGRTPRRRPRAVTPPSCSPPSTPGNLVIPLTLPVRKHAPDAIDRDKKEADRLASIGIDLNTPKSDLSKCNAMDTDETPEKRSESTPPKQSQLSEPLNTPTDSSTQSMRRVLVPETCDQSQMHEVLPVARKILVPDSCPTDEDEDVGDLMGGTTKPNINAPVLVPETPMATQITQPPASSIPLRVPVRAMSQRINRDEIQGSIPLKLPLASLNNTRSSVPKLDSQRRPSSILLSLPIRGLPSRTTDTSSFPITLRLPLSIGAFSQRNNENPILVPETCDQSSQDEDEEFISDTQADASLRNIVPSLNEEDESQFISGTLPGQSIPETQPNDSTPNIARKFIARESSHRDESVDEEDESQFIPGTCPLQSIPETQPDASSTPNISRKFLGYENSEQEVDDDSQFVPSSLLVPETPNPSDQPPPSLPLRLPLVNKTPAKSSRSIDASGLVSTPSIRGVHGTPSSVGIPETPSSRADSSSVDERRAFLVDAEEVNQIRRDFGLSPASSLGPGQSLALDPQMVSYTKRVLEQSAALASSPLPGSIGATAPVSGERSVSTSAPSAPRSACPFTPRKSGAVSRLTGTPSSSLDDSTSVARERKTEDSGESDDFYDPNTPKTAKKISINTNDSEFDTGRSSIHKRPRSFGAQSARQQLRFDLTPKKTLNLGNDSDNEISEPRKKVSRTVCDVRQPDTPCKLVQKKSTVVLPAKRRMVLDENEEMESPMKQLRTDPGSTVKSPKAVHRSMRPVGALENGEMMKSMFQTGAGNAVMYSESKKKKPFNSEMEMTGFMTAKGKSLAVNKMALARVRNQTANLVPPTGVGDSRKMPRDSIESIVVKGTPATRPPAAFRSNFDTPGVGSIIKGSGVTTAATSIPKVCLPNRPPQIRQPIFTSARRVAQQEDDPDVRLSSRRGKPIPMPRLSGSSDEVLPNNPLGSEGLLFTSGRGKLMPPPKLPGNVDQFPGFTTAKGRSVPVPGFTTANGRNVTGPDLPGFTIGNGRNVTAPALPGFTTGRGNPAETPFRIDGMITPDLDAIFANAKKLTAHKNFRQPLFSTGNGRAVSKPKLETPALLGGRLLKTPSTSGCSNQPVARALPFNTASSPRRPDCSTEKGVTFRNLPLKTPGVNGLSSRRQLFQTPPVKSTRTRGASGLKSTPFKRPRRVPPVHPHRQKNSPGKAVKTTKNLELFFPKAEVPALSTCGKLVTSNKVHPGTSLDLREVVIEDPSKGAGFVFLKCRFGSWEVLPEEARKFCKFDEISVFGVDDCIALLTHVFPAAEKKPVTRIGSRDWTKMSYGLAVWKLFKLEAAANNGAVFLTVANLFREIWRRVDREWHKNQAPHLAQMLRRDASPRSHAVLMISGIHMGVKKTVTLEVTDGWYICRMRTCDLLAARVRAKHVDVGDKIHVFECELVSGNNDPFFFGDGDEMGANVLAPSTNCVKKVKEFGTNRLGIRKGPLFTRSSKGFRKDGGKCPGAQVCVLRSYPPFFIESANREDGESHSVFRKREAEEAAQAEFSNKMAARVADEEKGINDDEVIERRNVSMAIDFTVCGIADDPGLTANEKLIRIYRPNEDVVRLLAKEGSIVLLPPMKPSGRNWVTLSPAVRPLKISTTNSIIPVPRYALDVQQLCNHDVADGRDFDGVYVSVYITEPIAVGAARFAYLVDEYAREDRQLLVVELRGEDSKYLPRVLSKGMYQTVALRDVEMEGVDARLGVVHALATLRTEIVSGGTARKRRWTYLSKRADTLNEFVTNNRTRLDKIREAVMGFASGDSSQIRIE